MFGPRRMPDKVLADLLGRLSIAVASGVDLRRAWDSESARVPSGWRPAMRAAAVGIRRGDDLASAMERAGGGFPPVVTGMVRLGDRTGRLAEVLRETAASIEQSIRAWQALRQELFGPVVRLVVAMAAVAALILVSGMARGLDGRTFDVLGIGLTGRDGLATFLTVIAMAVAVSAWLVPAAVRSWRERGWVRPLGRRIPLLGGAARAAEASAWCRAAALAAHAGVGVGEMVALASAAAPGLAIDPAAVEGRLRLGDELATALARCGGLPREVLEAIAVGDMTGTTAEALDRMADRLGDAARRGFASAVRAAGFVIWGAVACLVAALVIRVMSSYIGMIHDAAQVR
jgi:type II secretory pathway component PulF